MASEPGQPTLDQLRVFLTVVDVGTFVGAARKLNRATSVISYTVANLEAQLGVQLFDRHATRNPQLTEAGRTVVAEARNVSNGVDGLRAKVKGLLQGLEAEVHLVIDVLMPSCRVVDALKAFRDEFPTVSLHLHVEALGAVTKLVVDRIAGVGVTGPLDTVVDGLERIGVGSVRLIPVAAPDHPLATARDNAPGAGRNHIQLVLTDRSALTEGRNYGVVSERTWRLADLGAKHMLLKENIGWGNMPAEMVADDIAAGRLVALKLPDLKEGAYPLDAIYRTDTPPGPAAAWLIARFRNQSDEASGIKVNRPEAKRIRRNDATRPRQGKTRSPKRPRGRK